ncbi:kinesin KIF3B [Micractinium conductrix]|uniref:Kinesin-like protein n=1 Tax=Micractinium conductrix TaxID=554055 RepID=A0A2P6V3Z3_9CHLO|nr:kinesin KIF3B [Micractinium conductrix]|eukprot:PSC68795.1 kinesin KIF3B [Micractinium conductrix]
MAASECVRVAVRCRPPNSREAGERLVVSVDDAAGRVELAISLAGEAPRAFTFDHAFGPGASQQHVYNATARELVDSALAGYNATLFAFGQTGTGKTHTMEGCASSSSSSSSGSGGGGGAAPAGGLHPEAGIIPRTFGQIFAAIGASQDQTFLVRASMLEIYNEEIRDLLSKNPKNRLDMHEAKDSSVYVKGLNSFVVKSEAEIAAVLEAGKRNRSVGATLMNQDSSRSHSVFTITIEAADAAAVAAGGASGGSGGSGIRVGKLNLVDLAGSERQAKTGAAGDRLKEASKINLSLSALGNVISALVDGKGAHVPYRDSKLTRLLQDSLGGNTRTVMIANVGPAGSNADESLSTLRYANRAKNIQNKPKINEDPKDAMLKEYQQEIARLKAQLEAAASGEGFADGGPEGAPDGGSFASSASSTAGAAGQADLDPDEVERMRQQLEAELRAEWSSSGQVVDDAALEQIQREVEVQLAAQVQQAQAEQRRAAKEAARLEQQLQQQSAAVAKVAKRRRAVQQHNAELVSKLRLLESKLLHGEASGGLDKLAAQKTAQLRGQREELARQRAAEEAAAARIAALEAGAQAVQQQYSTLQEEAEALTAQLANAASAYEAAKAELGDVAAQWEQDREELVGEIRALHYNLALKSLVIDAFIPHEEVSKLMRRISFDSNEGAWRLRSAAAAAAAAASSASLRGGAGGLPKRPGSAAPRSALPRRPSAALLELQLDIPERQPVDLSCLQFALEAVTMQ